MDSPTPQAAVAVSVTPGKTRMLSHQVEWGLLSRRDGILDRSRNRPGSEVIERGGRTEGHRTGDKHPTRRDLLWRGAAEVAHGVDCSDGCT
jgi:hypothetical protein